MSGLIKLLWEAFEEDCVLTGSFLRDFHSEACGWIKLSHHVVQKEMKSWIQQNDSS